MTSPTLGLDPKLVTKVGVTPNTAPRADTVPNAKDKKPRVTNRRHADTKGYEELLIPARKHPPPAPASLFCFFGQNSFQQHLPQYHCSISCSESAIAPRPLVSVVTPSAPELGSHPPNFPIAPGPPPALPSVCPCVKPRAAPVVSTATFGVIPLQTSPPYPPCPPRTTPPTS